MVFLNMVTTGDGVSKMDKEGEWHSHFFLMQIIMHLQLAHIEIYNQTIKITTINKVIIFLRSVQNIPNTPISLGNF
jgi:hypothetical protein